MLSYPLECFMSGNAGASAGTSARGLWSRIAATSAIFPLRRSSLRMHRTCPQPTLPAGRTASLETQLPGAVALWRRLLVCASSRRRLLFGKAAGPEGTWWSQGGHRSGKRRGLKWTGGPTFPWNSSRLHRGRLPFAPSAVSWAPVRTRSESRRWDLGKCLWLLSVTEEVFVWNFCYMKPRKPDWENVPLNMQIMIMSFFNKEAN